MKPPTETACIADKFLEAALERVDQTGIFDLTGQPGGAVVDRKQAVIERLVDIAIGIGADHALLDVEQHQIEDQPRVSAGLLEVVERLARCAEAKTRHASIWIEHLTDDPAIGFSDLVRRAMQQARRKEDLVVRVQRVQVAQDQQEILFLQAL